MTDAQQGHQAGASTGSSEAVQSTDAGADELTHYRNHATLVARLRSYGPGAFLALEAADRIDQLEREQRCHAVIVAEHKDTIKGLCESIQRLEIAKLRAEALAEQNRKDAERYRWLRDDPRGRTLSMSSIEWTGGPNTADAAIDVAMSGHALQRTSKPNEQNAVPPENAHAK